MKTSKKKLLIFIIISTILFFNFAVAPAGASLFPYNSFLPIWSPIFPANLAGLPLPLPTRTAQVPLTTLLGGGGAVAAPTVISTSWSGSWTSFLNTNQFGPMTLSLTEDLATGTFTGSALLSLNSLIPVSISVSGAYTGVGLNVALSGFYSALTPVVIGGGPLATVVWVTVDYLLTLNFDIVGGTEIIGTYSIDSTQKTDFGSIYLVKL